MFLRQKQTKKIQAAALKLLRGTGTCQLLHIGVHKILLIGVEQQVSLLSGNMENKKKVRVLFLLWAETTDIYISYFRSENQKAFSEL